MVKNPVPPDRPPPTKKHRRWPRTRRHRKRKITTGNNHSLPTIKSDTDLTAVLSSITNDIQKQSLTTLCFIYEESIATVQNEIFLDLQNVLRHTILHLGTKLRAEFANAKPKQKVFYKNSYRPPTQKDILPKEHKPQGCDERNYTDEEDFDKSQNSKENAFSDNEESSLGEDSNQGISYWAAGERIYPGHSDFDCRVQDDDKNGHIFMTEIDKEHEEFSEKDSEDGNIIFFWVAFRKWYRAVQWR